MANYTNEKLAWEALTNMFGGSKPTPNPALARINLPAPPKPNSGWSNPLGSLGNWISGAQDTPEVPTKGMLADRAAGTDTASRHAAMRASMPANLPAPKPSESFFLIRLVTLVTGLAEHKLLPKFHLQVFLLIGLRVRILHQGKEPCKMLEQMLRAVPL